MNRRKFFAGIAAAVTAACVPDTRIKFRGVPLIWDRGTGKAGWIAAHYGSGVRAFNEAMQWWRPNATYQVNFAEIEARTLASLQDMWKECRAYKTGDTLIIDEQAYEVFKTLQE